MARVLVLSSLSLTGISAIPSLSCVQWSDDGQLLLQTRNALYIMSPEMGISLGTLTSAIRQTPDARNGQGGSRLFRWRKTVISQRGGCTHQWPVDCQDFAAVSLGSIDPVLRRVAASPSNVTADAGCLLAVLNSNMELAIWGPVKNRLIGEWTQLLDITAEMRARYAENDKLSLVHVLQVQSTCIEWSSQADFGLSPAPQIDGSLLAVGNRAGSVSFIRLSVNVDGTYESRPVANITLSDRWLTHVAWSSWRLSESLKCEAFVACGVGDGSIVLVKVVQDVRPIPAAAGFFPNYELQATFEVLDIRPSDSNGRGITGMHWVDVGSNPVLVFFTAGFVHLYSHVNSDEIWSGGRAIPLHTTSLAVSSSTLCPPSGVTYVPSDDILVVSLTEGSFHVIYSLSTEPTDVPPSSKTTCTSTEMSRACRLACSEVEAETLSWKDVNRIHGFASYDYRGTYVWLHEICQPADFSYKHDAKHVSMLVVAHLQEEPGDDELVGYIQHRIRSSKAYTGQTPVALLRPDFLHLRESKKLSRILPDIIRVLDSTSPGDVVQFEVADYEGELSADIRNEFMKSLSTHLFGWDSLFRQRALLVLGEFCKTVLAEQLSTQSLATACSHIVSRIWCHVLHALIRHMRGIFRLVTAADVPFLLKLTWNSTLPSMPTTLVQQAEDLKRLIRTVVPHEACSDQQGLSDLCPACHTRITIEDISTAACPNGHVWSRCSITSFVLATPVVRTCIGCHRKAFLPPSQMTDPRWLPVEVRDSWLVADLLEAVRRCLYCGNTFVTLV